MVVPASDLDQPVGHPQAEPLAVVQRFFDGTVEHPLLHLR
jgi:hypothetical protein